VARLAVTTGAPVLPMAIYMRHNGKHKIRILPRLATPEKTMDKNEKITELTRRCSLAIEQLVRYDPKQWVWFHDRWREMEGVEGELEAAY
jgi:lauroyl/myristoyl acyltransferase